MWANPLGSPANGLCVSAFNGSHFTSATSRPNYTKSFELSEPVILKFEGGACEATEAGPSHGRCLLGSNNVLQGNTVGEYTGRCILAIQAEAR